MAMRIAAILIALTAALVLIQPELATGWIGGLTARALTVLGAPVLWLASGFLLLCLWLIAGPWGRLRLGRPEEAPEFGTFSWLSMLFAAGMGSGLVFWGVAEPLTHYASAPVPGLSELERARLALAVTCFHWGLHAWAIYAIAGLVVAWFAYRHAAPEIPSGAIDTGLAGLVGARARRFLGVTANALATTAVVFGVAGALANGTILLHTGIERAAGVALPAAAGYGLILAAMAIVFLASARSGIRRGIRWLSVGNIVLAGGLAAAVLTLTDPGQALRVLLTSLADYARMLPAWSVGLLNGGHGTAWARDWTVTYLLWWIAWAPFVGIFIARISRGRSVRAYVLGVLGAPVAFSFVWFAVLGGGALAYDREAGGVLSAAVLADYTRPMFMWLEQMPGAAGPALAWAVCVLLFVFLVTSADSAAYVLGMLGHEGDPEPPNQSKLLWGGLTVLLGAGLLASGSADVIRSVAIAGAIPYALLLVLQVFAWLRGAVIFPAGKAELE